MTPIPTAVLLSGGGRTLQTILDSDLPVSVRGVISSDAKAFGLERAHRAGVPCWVERRRDAPSTEAYAERIFARCRELGAELVLLAGFLKLLRPIPAAFQGKVLNIHPSLIPAFCGKGFYGSRVHRAVLESGVKITGCTVHFVDDEYDHGPIVLQRAVAVQEDDTVDSLAARVFEEEKAAYAEAIRLFAAGRLSIRGRRVRITPAG